MPKTDLERRPVFVVGDLVDYHSIIGGPVTKPGLRIVRGPDFLGGHTWVYWLDGKRGCVAAEACTRSTSGGKAS